MTKEYTIKRNFTTIEIPRRNGTKLKFAYPPRGPTFDFYKVCQEIREEGFHPATGPEVIALLYATYGSTKSWETREITEKTITNERNESLDAGHTLCFTAIVDDLKKNRTYFVDNPILRSRKSSEEDYFKLDTMDLDARIAVGKGVRSCDAREGKPNRHVSAFSFYADSWKSLSAEATKTSPFVKALLGKEGAEQLSTLLKRKEFPKELRIKTSLQGGENSRRYNLLEIDGWRSRHGDESLTLLCGDQHPSFLKMIYMVKHQ
ncbi:MAG: hypothetical protein AABW79_02890 [Nanoarchaeota archaeon]